MPLFRFHCKDLKESLLTTKIVKNKNELINLITTDSIGWPMQHNWNIKIESYPDKDSCFDERIGWYTQIVTADRYEKNIYHPVGFLSEPLDD